MTRTQYLARRWRRHAYAWLDQHDIDPRAAVLLVAALAITLLYLGHRMGV